jgi:hypothetical protein
MLTKKCFVISPIGAPDTGIREAADDVFDFIIKPALDGLEIEAIRADKLADPGLITEQMLAAILNYDLCIADLSGHNPNVFYELAIAQAAERPVVILKRAGDLIPFDVKDYRLIEYDLKPRSIKTDKWIPILQEQVRRVTSPGYTPPRLLRGRSVSKSEGIRSYLISARSQEFGDPPRYFDVVEQAQKYCYLMGVSLKSWGNENAKSVLRSVTARGVAVKVLIIDEDHPGLAAMINRRLPSEDLDVVKRQTTKMAEHFLAIAKTMSSFEVRRVREGLPHFQLIVTDDTALVLQYMFSRGTADSPLQQFPAGTPLHIAFKDEFEALWALNA